MRTIHNFTQGTDAWKQHRTALFNASEAPAVMGASKHTTRSELLRQKATGLLPEVNAHTQALFDRGHAVEPPTVAMIEDAIGDSLAPVVASMQIDGLTLGASYDGLSLMEDVGCEIKLWNEELAEQVRRGELEPHYYWQLEHHFIVTPSLKRIIFATSDGTPERFVYMEYRPVPGRAQQLIAAWKQFQQDVAAYVPPDIKERPAAEVTLALPALVIHAKGEITTSNMKEYGEALAKRLAEVRAIALVTDQDFSNAKESAKLLRENIQQAKLAKEQMLAQTVSVGEAARMIDAWCEDMRLTALKLEQDVEREDKAKKAAMIAKAKADYEQYVQALIAETRVLWTAPAAPNWPDAIKNKRNFTSMQDALDTMLANAKIAASEVAARVQYNREQLRPQNGVAGDDWIRLFPDFAQVCTKATEDFHNLVTARVTAERARIEAERARIRAEEEARAREVARQEQEAREAEERRQRAAAEEAERQRIGAAEAEQRREGAARAEAQREVIAALDEQERRSAEALRQALPASAPANVVPMPTKAPAPAAKPTLKLGDINTRLQRCRVTEADLEALGFPAAAHVQNACMYFEADYPAIVSALIQHLASVRELQRQVA